MIMQFATEYVFLNIGAEGWNYQAGACQTQKGEHSLEFGFFFFFLSLIILLSYFSNLAIRGQKNQLFSTLVFMSVTVIK